MRLAIPFFVYYLRVARNLPGFGRELPFILLAKIHRKKKPERFLNFLEFYDTWDKAMYAESGFAVEALVNKYGKHKLLDLIRRLDSVGSPNDFDQLFMNLYGSKPSYGYFNGLLGS